MDGCNWPRGLVCLVVAIVAACHDARPKTRASVDFLQLDSGVALGTTLVRDTVDMGESVEMWVVFRNGGRPTEINNTPDRLWIEVQTESGGRVDPFQASSIDAFLGGMAIVVLPRNSVFAQLVALDCVGLGYGPRAACDYGYRFPNPGSYRVITTFRGLTTDTGGTVLVDTATVVVRSGAGAGGASTPQ